MQGAMTMLKKTLFAILLSIPVAVLFQATLLAHEGEDHGTNEVVAPVGQMNVRVSESEVVAVVVKYATPKPAEEITLMAFLTDLKTNAPIGGVPLSMAFRYISSTRTSGSDIGIDPAAARSIEVVASPTETPGIYQAEVSFPEVGEYDLALTLGGDTVAGQVDITGIIVPDFAAQGSGAPWGEKLPLALGAVALFLLAGTMSFFFWVRPGRDESTGELTPVHETASK